MSKRRPVGSAEAAWTASRLASGWSLARIICRALLAIFFARHVAASGARPRAERRSALRVWTTKHYTVPGQTHACRTAQSALECGSSSYRLFLRRLNRSRQTAAAPASATLALAQSYLPKSDGGSPPRRAALQDGLRPQSGAPVTGTEVMVSRVKHRFFRLIRSFLRSKLGSFWVRFSLQK
jgi:hypothetical protein